MLRYLIMPLAFLVLLAVYKIIKQLPESLRVSREKKRRETEHLEYMAAYNTRRHIYGDMYGVSRKFNLSGAENALMQSNISCCNEDDEVELVFEQDEKRYAASCNGGKIGYLPASANEIFGELREYKAIITKIGFTRADKYCVQITVFSNE